MGARAIWKGRLLIAEEPVPVKLYSAVEDRKIHFRLLHAADLTPVDQRIVRKTDGEAVPKEERRKAFPLDGDTAVMLRPEELDEIEPEAEREIALCRFVPQNALSDQWYDRPYYLGPDEDEDAYFALAQAIERRRVAGIARWVMRKKRYVGALTVSQGHLMMITLRRAEQVLAVSVGASSAEPDEKELRLAEQLVASVSDDFEPGLWQDEYRERVRRLIEAKRKGKPLKLRAPERKRATGGLAEQLRQSIAAMTERKVA